MTGLRVIPGWGQPWPAPAKLNLFLRIIGRREDGYHQLQTVFQLVNLFDRLIFAPADDAVLMLSGGVPGIDPADELCIRAARALIDRTGCGQGVAIRLHKNIPVGGGMGGGSSDAATTLIALNHLWRLGLGTDELAAIGAGLGADVPVFVHGHSAWGEDIGQILTPIDLPQRWFVVVHPGVTVSTAEIFASPTLTRNSTPLKIRSFLRSGADNDCEREVCDRYPQIGEVIAALGRYGKASLTGTGACVFVAFDRHADATECYRQLAGKWQSWLLKGMATSPVRDVLPARQGGGT